MNKNLRLSSQTLADRQSLTIIINSFIVIIISLILISCGSTRAPEPKTSEVIFNEAKALYDDEDYPEAKKLFEVILLQYPASQFADDAQYWLAETHFHRDEFILAAFNYNRLRSAYPNSPYAKEAQYKAAMSYYELSPYFDREPEYTQKAIDEFNLYQRLYPGDSLFAQTGKYIEELRDKLALREFFTAELYKKWDEPKASIIYYDAVINNFPDTQYFERAYIGKIEALVEMQHYDEAAGIINLYRSMFRQPKYLKEIESLESTMDLSKAEN